MKQFLAEIFYGAAILAVVVSVVTGIIIIFLLGLAGFPPFMLLAVVFLLLVCNVLGKMVLTWLNE